MQFTRHSLHVVDQATTSTLSTSIRPTRIHSTTAAASVTPTSHTPIWNTTALNGTTNATIETNPTKSNDNSDFPAFIAFIPLVFAIALAAITLVKCCFICCGAPDRTPEEDSNAGNNTHLSPQPSRRTTRNSRVRRSNGRGASPGRLTSLFEPPSLHPSPPRAPEVRERTQLSPAPPAPVQPQRRPGSLTILDPVPMAEINGAARIELPPEPPAYQIQPVRRMSEDGDHGSSSPPPLYRAQTREDEQVLTHGEVQVPAPAYRRHWNPWEGNDGRG